MLPAAAVQAVTDKVQATVDQLLKIGDLAAPLALLYQLQWVVPVDQA
jgi:hypothetical protein